ncbi:MULTISPECIES: hypothetical protein [Arthrobacter]|uniref:hypothetical protein n=1 Tax=Arthrobacter TaxID=1663 RepID=UPI00140487F2|nr:MULTISPECIES: hypothetical protein [Arthrobacter]MBT8161035.1 hypothetical protein [Arthrobacter sp. GN70]
MSWGANDPQARAIIAHHQHATEIQNAMHCVVLLAALFFEGEDLAKVLAEVETKP